MTHLYPLARQTWASPIPVFPAVPSTTVPPGFNLIARFLRMRFNYTQILSDAVTHRPLSSASRTTPSAARSLTLPPGF